MLWSVCMHWCLCTCTVSGIVTKKHFHSSSVSPSKGTASVSMWKLLGSLLPTQPMGVRLKEGRQAASCWYTNGGSGSSLGAGFGTWNFMNWLAFSKPPKGMAHLQRTRVRALLQPAVAPELHQSQSFNEEPVKAFPIGDVFVWNGSRHWCF